MFKSSRVRNQLLTYEVFLLFLVRYMLGDRLNISVLATSWFVIHGAIESSVESITPLWNKHHRLCIYGKETGHISPALNPAKIFNELLVITLSNPINVIAMACVFVKVVQEFSIMNFSIWCFNSVLNNLNTDMSRGWMIWLELDSRRTKLFLNLIAFSKMSVL